MRRQIRTVALPVVLVAAALLAVSAGTTAAAASAPDTKCTIIGTQRNDRLVGTPGDDVICGLGGNDTLIGNGGNDILIGGPGNDKLTGGNGSDTLVGNEGRDALSGGSHSDRLVGGADRDRLSAGTAGDTCAPDGDDQVSGQCRADVDAPIISDISIPVQVAAGDTLTLSWRVTDASGLFDLAEVSFFEGASTSLYIGGSGGPALWCGIPVLSTRISGDAFDGRYEVACPVPDTAVNGEYFVFFFAGDLFGNVVFTDVYSFTVAGG